MRRTKTAFQLSKAHTSEGLKCVPLATGHFKCMATPWKRASSACWVSKQVVVAVEGRGKRESFHRHPAKREGHGRSSITAGVRKRQRFRVVRLGGGEVRETVKPPLLRQATPSYCLPVFPLIVTNTKIFFYPERSTTKQNKICISTTPQRCVYRGEESQCNINIVNCGMFAQEQQVKSDHLLCEPAKIPLVVPDAGVALAHKLLHSPLKEHKQEDIWS